jgi:hypothetical protein
MKKAGFEIEDDKVSVWFLDLWNLHFSPLNFGKMTVWSPKQNSRLWTELRINYGQNFSVVMNLWHFQYGPPIW